MRVNWSNFTPSNFENFCAAILEESGFKNIVWHGAGGGDRGRDLTASKQVAHLSSLIENARWIVQCRRYLAKPPTKSEIHDWLVACNEHKPDYCLLIVTNTLTSDTKDWLSQEQAQFKFKIFVWEERDILRELARHRRALAPRFAEVYWAGSPVEFYQVKQGEYSFFCNEFEEVGFVTFNCYSEAEAREKIGDFIDFLRANDPFVE
ncbi:restriction endonuclease [Rubrivivax gelatinosus]|uniref:restriction endonuclease n=1 Tax=Rubrivivax gelatinosus TaxID=28068 RepID=UPI0009DB1D32|nr:restriction endonuclease [Rubrivivax gelatinosus]MBG6078324.1 hypothetical protein [Rubrivivax gelatinosus]